MLTSKQRAKLRALANSAEMILQVGKGGISPHLVKQADEGTHKRRCAGNFPSFCERSCQRFSPGNQ